VLELSGPSSLRDSVQLLLDNEIFTPSTFLSEFAEKYAALSGCEIERLLLLAPGTLSIERLSHKTLPLSLKSTTP
jgi:predicted ATP-dependent endonuclease of OLD family